MPMLDCCRKLMQRGRKLPGWLWFLLFLMVLVVVALLVPLIIFTIRANSKSCKDGLQAEQECQNSTNLLQRQLTQTEEVLQETKAQATICIQSVDLGRDPGPRDRSPVPYPPPSQETLRDSLEKEKALGREQLARAEELQDEVLTLKQKLNTLEEAERQRKRSEASAANSSSSCWSILGFLITLNMLILCLESWQG
ncbi:bone marrow stromal antigen 2 isoform X1 [Camelus dromedarius]|uniref:bone marrow stromal antigen 2 isoform X1 n=1 Tax=Camelus dromedarius TaxID=9838 RepID=UPI00311A3BA2